MVVLSFFPLACAGTRGDLFFVARVEIFDLGTDSGVYTPRF
jgi:hypothetical protein